MKKVIICFLIIFMSFTFLSCKKEEMPLDKSLKVLLPEEEGFQWAYKGADSYYHEMVLESISENEKKIIYAVKGEVENVTNVNKDTKIELYYNIEGNALKQIKSSELMNDSTFDEITLIKTPLQVGNKWDEKIKVDGKKVEISSEIVDIEDNEKGKIYKVKYLDKKTGYMESRKIMEGIGVISFTNIIKIDDNSFYQGYGLYGANSGYITSEDDENDKDDETENDGQTENDDVTNGDNVVDIGGEEDEKDNAESPDLNVINEDEEEKVKEAIKNFNNSWISYVNDGDESFFNYVNKDSSAYKNAKKFNSEGLKEEFLSMELSDVNINGNTATITVYEEIKKTKNEEVKIAKYNWIYTLVKKDEKWLVDSYKKK